MHSVKDCVTIARDMALEPVLVVAIAAAKAEGIGTAREIDAALGVDPEVVQTVLDALRPVQVAKPQRKTRIKETWAPSDADRDYARRLGFSDYQVDGIATKFRQHYLESGTPWLRWDMVWQRWCRGEAERRHILPPKPDAPQGNDVWRTAMRAWRERRSWPHSLGPEPGRPGCRVPAELLEKQESLL